MDAEQDPKQDEKRAEVRTGDEPMQFCPVCSMKLNSHRCKLICERCGYYMSCADYY